MVFWWGRDMAKTFALVLYASCHPTITIIPSFAIGIWRAYSLHMWIRLPRISEDWGLKGTQIGHLRPLPTSCYLSTVICSQIRSSDRASYEDSSKTLTIKLLFLPAMRRSTFCAKTWSKNASCLSTGHSLLLRYWFNWLLVHSMVYIRSWRIVYTLLSLFGISFIKCDHGTLVGKEEYFHPSSLLVPYLKTLFFDSVY